MALVFPAPAQIKNLLDPTANTDAATKQYVDSSLSAGTDIVVGNVTSSGTVVSNSIQATGNITSNNANLGNLVTANYISGDGSLLTNISGSNVTGTVSNANYASYAGNITLAAQPNITSLGTLTSLTVTGNVIAGNANLGNLVTANYVAGALTTGSQPNITSTGTLTSLSVTGNITSGNLNSLGSINGVDLVLTGNLTVSGNTTYINSTVTAIEDPLVYQGGGANNATLTSNDGLDRGVVLNYYSGSAKQAYIGWKNANAEIEFASNISVSNGVVTISSLANIRAGNANFGNSVTSNYFIGSGNNLSNIQASNITGTVANANYSLYAGTVLTNAQPNITSVGTLTNLTVTGNITSGNANLGNLVIANYYQGTLTTGIQPNITSVGTLTNLTVTANISSGNANLGNIATASYFVGNGSNLSAIAGSNVTGTVANANYALYSGTVTTASQPNITSTGTLTSLIVTGNVTSGNISGGNLIVANYFSGDGSLLSNISGSNVTGQVSNSLVAGTVYTNAQPNITSVGTLTSLTVSGSTNLGSVGNVKITGGNANFILSTDGTGNLSWTSPSSTGTLTANVDSFVGDGTTTSFTLAHAPIGGNYTIVAVQGILQPKTSYTISGTTITFGSAPYYSALIEVTTFGGSVVAPSSGGSSFTWNVVNSNVTMSANNGYFADTSTGAKTLTLPGSPTLGDTIRINDLAGTFNINNLTVAANSKKIQGSTDDLLIDYAQASVTLVYSNSTYGWKILES